MIFQVRRDGKDTDSCGFFEPGPALDEALIRLIGGRGAKDVYLFNDTRTHTEVLALLDRAIAERTSELSAVEPS